MKTTELLLFDIAGYEFGIPLNLVEEVVPASRITDVPKGPPFLLGLAAVRGKVLAVIDAAKRCGLGNGLNSHFLLCNVRGNMTAVTIDEALLAGALHCRELTKSETLEFRTSIPVNEKFLKEAYELFEKNENEDLKSTGRKFFVLNTDLFVSNEMASKVGEA